MDPSLLSLLPPIIAITLAILTKQVIVSLFVSVWLGATMAFGFNPVLGLYRAFTEFIFPSMGDSYNASLLIMIMLCGAFGLLMERGGGAHAFASALANKIRTPRQAQLLTAAGGTAIFFSDATNPVLVGPIFRPITDSVRVSREKLAYIVDATTATFPSMIPFTAWGVYIISIIAQQFEDLGNGLNATAEFMSSVPFTYYTIGAVIFVYIISALGVDYGPMRIAENRARTQGKLVEDSDAEKFINVVELPAGAKPTMASMIVPVVVLVVAIFGGLLWTGGFPERSVTEALANSSSMQSLVVGFFLADMVAAFFAVHNKVLTPSESMETFFEGIRKMMDAILILVLSWAIGSVCKTVGTAAFVVSATEGFLTPTMMFIAMFIICAFTAFFTGTSWGTFAIFLPISIPLAAAIGAPMSAAIGTVISGAIFGDHCSPISDTTILSAMGASCHHIAHVKTQLPYALTVAGSASIAYLFTGLFYTALGPVVCSVIGIAITVGLSTIFAVIMKRKGENEDIKAETAK